MSVLLLGLVTAGFWPQYYWQLLQGIELKPLLLATYSLALVGIARLFGRLLMPDHFVALIVVCLAPILLAMVHDSLTQRRVHWVYALGIVLFFVRLQYLNIYFARSEFWQPIGRALLQPFL